MSRTTVPEYAADFPEVAQTMQQVRLPFYCCNCLRKRETTWLTPNFGPFCDDCLKEAEKVGLIRALADVAYIPPTGRVG